MFCLKARAAGLILCLGVCPAASRASAFEYPSVPATPARQRQVEANLFREYFAEQESLRALDPGLRSALIHQRNLELLEELRREPMPDGPVTSIGQQQAQRVLDLTLANPVAGEEALLWFDPTLSIGFCFGRAAYAHLELLRRGVDPLSLGKLFAIGDLKAQGTHWDFHVTTVARAPDGQWWAVDPLQRRVMKAALWMREVEKLDRDPAQPQIRFYFTDAVKFQPHLGAYSSSELRQPLFRGYFEELARWFAVRKCRATGQPGSGRSGFASPGPNPD